MAARESQLTAKIRERAVSRRAWMRKAHGGPHGAGWPDLVGVYRGVSLMLEVKLPGKENTLTELQRQTLIDLRAAGSIALMVTSVRQVDYVLDCIDVAVADHYPAHFYVRNQAAARHISRCMRAGGL